MKLLHIIGATLAGGAERVAVDLACQLEARGHRIAMFALAGEQDDVGRGMRSQLAAAGVGFSAGPPGSVGPGAVRQLASLITRQRPSIVHLHTANTELAHALASLMAGRRHAAARTLHNVSLPRSKLYQWAYRRNGVRVSAACSAAVAEANADWASPVVVIPNGVTFEWECQSPDVRAGAAAALGLNPAHRHFLSVGSMRGAQPRDAQKAHDIMIAAWQRFARDRTDCELHLVGDGNLRAQLESLAAGHPTIHFHGISARIHTWLQACDAFVMPSRYEGLPIAGIEALGTGVPVIFSDIAPLKALAPAAVEWVRPDDVEGLAVAFDRVASGRLKGNAGDAGRIRSAYGVERMTEDYIAYYERLLAANG